MLNPLGHGVAASLYKSLSPRLLAITVGSIESPNGHRAINTKTVEDLKKSIAAQGLIQPIGVVAQPKSDQPYRLVYGQHRLQAWIELYSVGTDDARKRWHEIPVTIYPEDASADSLKLVELEENMVREDLTSDQRKTYAGKLAKIRKSLKLNGTSKNGGTKSSKGTKCTSGTPWSGLTKSTGVPKQTLINWWKAFTLEKGYPADAPSKQLKKVEDEFIDWLEGAKERQEAEQKEKEEAATAEKENRSFDVVKNALNALAKKHGVDVVRAVIDKWILSNVAKPNK